MAIPRPNTSQFEAFTTNLAYARKMVDAGRYLAPFQPGTVDVDDFYRAAWVQAVAAIDHWFHEELFRRVAELAAKDSPEMPLQLRNYEIPLHRVEAVQRGDVTLADVAGDLKQRRPISEPDVTDAINWIDRIALAVAHVLDE
ncbi:hypothetical protein [Streptomyces sp. NPDC005795]|uniref:hypothetical protein n=1 Tax=Streptomyces sp. NPDC005795 TaxID=3154677 RepID=UPI0033C240A8